MRHYRDYTSGRRKTQDTSQAVLELVVLAFSFSLPSATSSCNSMLCCVWTQPFANNCVSPRRLSSQECAHLSQQGVGWGGGGGEAWGDHKGRWRPRVSILKGAPAVPDAWVSGCCVKTSKRASFKHSPGAPCWVASVQRPESRWVCAPQALPQNLSWTWVSLVGLQS